MSKMPVRVQLSRKKGWRMPENTVKVTRPGPWGNQFYPGMVGVPNVATAIRLFRESIEAHPDLCRPELEKLRGKNLGCWCALDQPCHADVLLELANQPIAKLEPA